MNDNRNNNDLNNIQKPSSNISLKYILDASVLSFGKGFLLYTLPMSLLRGGVKNNILRRASAIGAFMGFAKTIQMYLGQNKNEILKYYSQAIAGALGASLALYIDSDLGYNTFVIWIAIRAVRCLLEDNILGDFLKKIPHKSTIVMCLSASQILSSWVRYPNEMDKGYNKFLDFQGGRPKSVMGRFRAPNNPVPYPLLNIRKPGHSYLSDGFIFFLAGLKRGSKLYKNLYIASFIFSLFQLPKYNNKQDRFLKLLKNCIINICRSSLFLSAYVTIFWMSWPILKFPFFNYSYKKGATRVSLRRHVWTAGLSTLLERKERRPELAAYCSTYALDSIWRRLESSYPFLKKKQQSIFGLLLILSCSILLHYHNKQPALLSKWILGFETPK